MINKDTKITFEIPETLRNAIEEAEKAYAEDGELGQYMNRAKTIDNICKQYYSKGVLTEQQWDAVIIFLVGRYMDKVSDSTSIPCG